MQLSQKDKTRFWKKVLTMPSNCWEWQSALIPTGYGRMTVDYKQYLAHRIAWQITNGDIAENLCVLHKCDNRKCVNPAHLFLGTYLDNRRDCIKKGRSFTPKWNGINNPNVKLNINLVKKIREIANKFSASFIAKQFGINRATVYSIIKQKTWRTI